MRLRTFLAFLISLALLSAASFPAAAGATATFTPLALSYQATDGYSPAQIATAYGMTGLTQQGIAGAGQTIALIDFDRWSMADIRSFDAAFGLPNPTIRQYYVGGKKFTLEKDAETTLDLEWAHAMAPNATLQVYYIKNNQPSRAGWKMLGRAIDLAVKNGAGMISMSFGSCTADSGYEATQQALARALSRGVSTFVASGDTGALPGPVRACGPQAGVSYPASDPSVVSVGGTTLALGSDDTILSELAWRLSGGGQGAPFSRPTWQVASTLPDDSYRWAPDVAFLGDARTGVAILYQGVWHRVGGTSLGAPAWAGIWALVGQSAAGAGKSAGAASSLLYRIGNSPDYSRAFNDITEGGNGLYSAGPGWDAVTGWGTPRVGDLAAVVQSIS